MKLKELSQNDFKMRIIQDLGMKPSRGSSSRNIRFAIFECTKCGSHFETSISGAKSKKQSKCKSCSQETHGFSKSNLYQRYYNMLSRCYNKKAKHYSCYGAIGVTVCEEWKCFQTFLSWCISNREPHMQDWQIDKDILCPDCKIYSPETCAFVPQEINKLFTNTKNSSLSTGLTLKKGFIQ